MLHAKKLYIGRCISILAMMSITSADHEYHQALFTTSENCLLFDPNPLSVRTTMSSVSCSLRCARERRCKSANFVSGDSSCSLLDKTETTHAHLVQCGHFGAAYLKKVHSDTVMSRSEGQRTQQGTFFEVKKDHSFLNDEIIWSNELKSLMLCLQMGARKVDCKSANCMTEKGTCSLLGQKVNEKSCNVL
ncbi:hypothetical protein P5673_024721 [Acropora cervicornis]|uniref:Apple domain-containing protein n=1 Tax=Acropora cervicornis TaxID=6130 RepID=A0AAD9Q3D3_ACRCE|nr:hypothetical protein P5673_024721 [Acropora cervicornis]